MRGLTPPRGAGPDPVHHRLGAGAGRQAAVLAEHDVEGLLEVSWERQETSRTNTWVPAAAVRTAPRRAQWSVRYQITSVTAQRRGDRTPGGADGLAGAGDQRGGGAAVVGGCGAGLPRGLVRGACVSPVEGPAAGDSAAVRAP